MVVNITWWLNSARWFVLWIVFVLAIHAFVEIGCSSKMSQKIRLVHPKYQNVSEFEVNSNNIQFSSSDLLNWKFYFIWIPKDSQLHKETLSIQSESRRRNKFVWLNCYLNTLLLLWSIKSAFQINEHKKFKNIFRKIEKNLLRKMKNRKWKSNTLLWRLD